MEINDDFRAYFVRASSYTIGSRNIARSKEPDFKGFDSVWKEPDADSEFEFVRYETPICVIVVGKEVEFYHPSWIATHHALVNRGNAIWIEERYKIVPPE
jgi:hypothetical protein